MLDLLRWHGAEEVEHRNVAFDLFQHVSGSYVRRLETMVVSAFALAFLWIAGTRFFMQADPTRPGKASWRSYRRAVRQGRAPSLREVYGTMPDYLRRTYHPDAHGDTTLALAYLDASPAARAAAEAAT
jgi:predicted metal-dependent hydrolase